MNNLIGLQIIKSLTTIIERVCGGVLCVHALSCSTLSTLWTVACQAPLSVPFPRKEYRGGLPFPTPKETDSLPLSQLGRPCGGKEHKLI